LLKMEDIPQHCVYLPHTVRIAVCIVVLQHVTRQTYRVGQPRGAARCLPTAAACTCSRPTWPVALLPNRMRFVRSQWKEQRATYGVDKHQPSTSQQRQAHCCTRGWNASGGKSPKCRIPALTCGAEPGQVHMFSGKPGSRPSRSSTGGEWITTVASLHNSGLEVRGCTCVMHRPFRRGCTQGDFLHACRHGMQTGTACVQDAAEDLPAGWRKQGATAISQNSQVHILCEDAMLHITASRNPQSLWLVHISAPTPTPVHPAHAHAHPTPQWHQRAWKAASKTFRWPPARALANGCTPNGGDTRAASHACTQGTQAHHTALQHLCI